MTVFFQVGMFDLKHRDVPCVGVSLGMERLFSIMEAQVAKSTGKMRTTETEVFVASAQKNLIEERMKILAHLWDNDIKVKSLNSALIYNLTFIFKSTIAHWFSWIQSSHQSGFVKYDHNKVMV